MAFWTINAIGPEPEPEMEDHHQGSGKTNYTRPGKKHNYTRTQNQRLTDHQKRRGIRRSIFSFPFSFALSEDRKEMKKGGIVCLKGRPINLSGRDGMEARIRGDKIRGVVCIELGVWFPADRRKRRGQAGIHSCLTLRPTQRGVLSSIGR